MDIFNTEDFKNAWKQVNFGKEATPESVLNKTTLKVGLGYHIGSGSTFLLEEIGFIKDSKLTAKGKDYLFEICVPKAQQ